MIYVDEVMRMEGFPIHLSCLSIIVNDVDDKKSQTERSNDKPESGKNPYPKRVLDDAIRDILEEAELRKFEFRKLLEEHKALIENLKKMENENLDRSSYVSKSPITA